LKVKIYNPKAKLNQTVRRNGRHIQESVNEVITEQAARYVGQSNTPPGTEESPKAAINEAAGQIMQELLKAIKVQVPQIVEKPPAQPRQIKDEINAITGQRSVVYSDPRPQKKIISQPNTPNPNRKTLNDIFASVRDPEVLESTGNSSFSWNG